MCAPRCHVIPAASRSDPIIEHSQGTRTLGAPIARRRCSEGDTRRNPIVRVKRIRRLHRTTANSLTRPNAEEQLAPLCLPIPECPVDDL